MSQYAITFPTYYDDLAAMEIESKGYLDDVLVDFDDGRSFVLSFRDSWNVQLDHDATATISAGIRVLAIPNLVIVETVSRTNVIAAIEFLTRSDFFDRVGPARKSS